MSSAEHLLNEAQFAFANVSFGQSLANTRHRARARSLCRKIIRKYPASMEAAEARALLRRLGDESYTSQMPVQHRHMTRASHHVRNDAASPRPVTNTAGTNPAFDWSGLLSVILMTPKVALGVMAAVIFVLLSLFGPFLAFALVLLVILTGPFRSLLGPAQREQVNDFIVRANAFIDERRRSGTGFS